MSVYDFDEQHTHGERGEDFLDGFFAARGHLIQEATRGQQRKGIDRVFLWEGKMALIEYKTDYIAHRSGQVFIETISVDTEDRAGWATTSEADYLIYFVPGQRRIYVIPLMWLREQLPTWHDIYPVRTAQNKGYHTHGLLVPIEVFETHASQVFDLPPGPDSETR